jgi:adenosine deaminase
MLKAFDFCGFSKAEMATLVQNAVEMSWADEVTKREISTELKELMETEK